MMKSAAHARNGETLFPTSIGVCQDRKIQNKTKMFQTAHELRPHGHRNMASRCPQTRHGPFCCSMTCINVVSHRCIQSTVQTSLSCSMYTHQASESRSNMTGILTAIQHDRARSSSVSEVSMPQHVACASHHASQVSGRRLLLSRILASRKVSAFTSHRDQRRVIVYELELPRVEPRMICCHDSTASKANAWDVASLCALLSYILIDVRQKFDEPFFLTRLCRHNVSTL